MQKEKSKTPGRIFQGRPWKEGGTLKGGGPEILPHHYGQHGIAICETKKEEGGAECKKKKSIAKE